MNDYQIMQDIGKSKYAMVYKGRKKKTIQYYALKCVDKSQKQKIMREVRFLHRLRTPYAVQFHEWFETANHLWLILELCPGNRLIDMLQVDLKLPELSANMLGLNLLAALHFLHSNGIVYNNLKPSTILLDAQGLLKLSDFSLAMHTNTYNDPQSEESQRCKRGTPTYMAPELFRPDGVCSFASDLWALGCIMYEMVSGRPPFLKSNFKALVTSVVTDAYAPLQNLSDDFNDLCGALLEKNVLYRLSWEQVRTHPFWAQELPDADLPNEPAFEEFCAKIQEEQVKESEDTEVESPKQYTPRTRQEENSLRKSGIDIVRLSQVVENNRDKTSNSGIYRTKQGGSEAVGEFELGQDEEVDFTAAGDNNGDSQSKKYSNTDNEVQDETEENYQNENEDGDEEYADPSSEKVMYNYSEVDNVESEIHGNVEGKVAARPLSAPMPADPEKKAQVAERHEMSGRPITAFAAVQAESLRRSTGPSVAELLFFLGDLQVRPIIGNKKIEKMPSLSFDEKSIPFQPMSDDEICSIDDEQFSKHLAEVHRALGDKTPISSKVSVLTYLENLSSNAAVSDSVLNSNVGLLLIRILRETKSAPLRARVAQTVGVLVRSASFISPELQQAGAIAALTTGVRDREAKVRRRAMAAFGELLYYIVSQAETNEDGVEGQRVDEDEIWSLPPAALQVLVRGLRPGEDEVVQHYAAQTIDNICSQMNERASALRSVEVLSALISIVSSAQVEALRGTAASAMSRIVRLMPSLACQIIDKVNFQSVIQRLNDDNAKVQQGFINILNVALVQPNQRLLKSLNEQSTIINSILTLFDSATMTVRAKAILTVRLLASISPQWLSLACDKRLMPSIEKMIRDKDAYLQRCIEGLISEITELIPNLVASIAQELSKATGAKGMAAKAINPGDDLKPPRTPFSYLPIILHVITSPSLRSMALNPTVIRNLAECVLCSEIAPFHGCVEFRRVLYLVIEALSQSALVLQNHEAITANLLPVLVQTALREEDTATSGGNTRYICLRATGDMLAALMAEVNIYDPAAQAGSGSHKEEHAAAITRIIHELLVRSLFPKFSTFLTDREPVPQSAIKIARLVMERNPAFGVVLDRLGLVEKFISFCNPKTPHFSLNSVCLVRAVVQCYDSDAQLLYSYDIAQHIAVLIKHVVEERNEDFFEPAVDMLNALLYHTVAALQDSSSDENQAFWINNAEPFLVLTDSLALLCRPDNSYSTLEANLQNCEAAAQGLLLLAHLFPAKVIQSEESAECLADALRAGNATMRKRIMKMLMWIINSGEARELQGVLYEITRAVRELCNEPGVIGDLSNEIMQSFEKAMAGEEDEDEDEDEEGDEVS
uniref:Protein kinase domain-containing protein n=1 Tax=Hanusia phi TaxID=3032 RepID=A0A7S0HXU4_9CRYP|mmetsp:Transcript_5750/g.13367  ORF Transcript_5750/g.13367 Transcript_5750/m.13367 type:complete len:1345 (+) Transcript_5750:147-4181(+)